MRRIYFGGVFILSVVLFTPLAQAASVGDGVDPDADDKVNAMVQQTDGKIIVGGRFSTLGGQSGRAEVVEQTWDRGMPGHGYRPGAGLPREPGIPGEPFEQGFSRF